jgi:hypothetical protein
MQPIRELGDLVEARWRRHDYRESRLAELARDALVELGLHERIRWRDLLRWCIRTPLCDSDNRGFGDVALRLHEGARFYVEALVWADGELAIHDHAFSGAFCVLSGSSLHVTYRFAVGELHNTGFATGALSVAHAEPLLEGDVRAIEAGRDFVHAVYHLARPTVTLVVRSRADLRALPQWSYVAPGIAFDPQTLARDAYAKPLAAMRVTAHVDPELHRELVLDAVRGRDIQLAFETVLRAARSRWQDDARLEELRNAAITAHPGLAAHLAPAIRAQARLLDLLARRRSARTRELQLLFALLLNVPERRWLLELVAHQTRADPVDAVLAWLCSADAEGLLPAALDPAQLDAVRTRLRGGRAALDPRLRELLGPLEPLDPLGPLGPLGPLEPLGPLVEA